MHVFFFKLHFRLFPVFGLAHYASEPINYCQYYKYKSVSTPIITSNREREIREISERGMATLAGYLHYFITAVNSSNITPTHIPYCTNICRPILCVLGKY